MSEPSVKELAAEVKALRKEVEGLKRALSAVGYNDRVVTEKSLTQYLAQCGVQGPMIRR